MHSVSQNASKLWYDRKKKKNDSILCIFTAHEKITESNFFLRRRTFHFVSSSLLLKERGIKQSTFEWEEGKEGGLFMADRGI